MSNFFSKIKIKTAQQRNRNKFDLSCNLVASHDFFQNLPVYVHECIPNETIRVDVSSLTRCAPLTQPLFGDIKMKYRAFFVPMRTIMNGFNSFLTQTDVPGIVDTYGGIIQHVQRIQLGTIYDYFSDVNNTFTRNVADSGSWDYEYLYTPSAGSPQHLYRQFTSNGKLAFKILCALGYKLNFASTLSDANDSQTYVSAMPFLAFCKIWFDWFSNPAYPDLGSGEAIFTRLSASPTLSSQDFDLLIRHVLNVCYGADYFTSAWDNPVAPNSGQVPVISVNDDTVSLPRSKPSTYDDGMFINQVSTNLADHTGGSTQTLYGTQNNTPTLHSTSNTNVSQNGSPANISQYILNVLHSVTDFVNRQRFAGTRALDRYMAEWGIQLKSEKLNRSVYVGRFDSQFQIGDVMQTTPNTEEGTTMDDGLGSYAGKMINSSNGSFSYSTDEFGFFIICCFIEPRSFYVDGRPRYLQHLNKFDFFQGDFDALGVQAIRKDELSNNFFSDATTPRTTWKADGIFGFTPRFAEYKTVQDNMIGDFLLSHYNTSLQGWALVRPFSGALQSIYHPSLRHDASFCIPNRASWSYIFQDTSSVFDHFFTIFNFKVDVVAPMKKLFDMYDYSNEDGKDMMIDVNGTSINS